jgi:Fe-S-cluster containining protein
MTQRFWDKGVRFECQGTGHCCTSRGSYGYVYFTIEDRRRLAKFLSLSTSSFTRRYCKKTAGYYHLKDSKGPCQFLKDKSCSVYSARPAQCRTWPFWPENMNARTWSREIKTFCPGIGKGKLYSKEEILKLLEQDPIC